MTTGNEGEAATAIEAIREAELETAWGYEFYEGLLTMSRQAIDAYGLQPVEKVKDPAEINEHDMSEIGDGLARFNATVVGPAELERVSAQMKMETGEAVPGKVLYGIEHGRIDAIVGFTTTKESSTEEQAAFFKTLYGAIWPEWQGWLGTAGGYEYLLAHELASAAGNVAEVALPLYRQRVGIPSSLELTSFYAHRVKNMIHQLFCTEEHLPDLGIPDAL